MIYEEIIRKVGKTIDKSVIYYDSNNNKYEIEKDNFVSAKLSFNSSIIGTLMQGLEVVSKEQLINADKIYLQVIAGYGNDNATKLYGPYYIKEEKYDASEKSYIYTMYDEILKTMVKYEPINITYPTTVYNYFRQLLSKLNISTNINSLPNGTINIESDIYEGIDFTYRSVLEDIAQANGVLFYLEDNVLKIAEFGSDDNKAVINDDILKNSNIQFGEHFGPVNVITLSRSGESDNIYYPEKLPDNIKELKIIDNQLMNDNNRDKFLPNLYKQLNGIEYDIFDTELTGYGGFKPFQKVEFETGNNIYTSYVFNNEIEFTNGYYEVIYTDPPEESTTDYTAADTTDQRINQVYIIANKQEKKITALVSEVEEIEKEVQTEKTTTGYPIEITDAGNYNIKKGVIDGKSEQETEKNVFDGTLAQTTYTGTGVAVENSATRFNLLKGYTYTLKIKFTSSNVVTTGANRILAFRTYTSSNTYTGIGMIINSSNLSSGEGTITFTPTEDYNRFLFVNYADFSSGTIEITSLEIITNTPSPDYPSEVKTIKGIENLIEVPKGTQTINGVTVTVDDDYTITFNGTCTTDRSVFHFNNEGKDNFLDGIYTLHYQYISGSISGNASNCNIQVQETTTWTGILVRLYNTDNKNTKTLNNNYRAFNIRFDNGAVFDNYKIKVQLEKSDEPHSIVPYGRWLPVKARGKNICPTDISMWESGQYGTNGVKQTNNARARVKDLLPVSQNTYIARCSDYSIIVRTYDKDKKFVRSLGIVSTFTINENEKYISVTLGESTGKVTFETYQNGFADGTIQPFIYLNSEEDKTFESYKETIIKCDLQGNELCKIGEVEDSIDLVSGVLTKRIGKIVLDGSSDESWNKNASYEQVYYTTTNSINDMLNSNTNAFMSDYYTFYGTISSSASMSKVGIYLWWGSNTTYKRVNIKHTEDLTLEEYKAWLSENPITVYYILETPQTIQLEPNNLELFKGYNYITIENEIDPNNMEITYLTDSKMNAQYATKSELEIAEGRIESEINATLEEYSKTTEIKNIVLQEVSESTNQIRLEVAEVEKDVEELSKETSASLELKIDKTDNNQVVSMFNASAQDINISGNRISIISDYFQITKEGIITSKAGNIGGWDIGDTRIYKNTDTFEVALHDGTSGNYLTVHNKKDNTYPFWVHSDGEMYAENANISGRINSRSGNIAGFTIDEWAIWCSSTGTTSWDDIGYRARIGKWLGQIGDFAFSVHKDNTVPFWVSYGGHLHAEDVDITGSITATSGSIGGSLVTGTISSAGIDIYNGTGFVRALLSNSYHPYVSALNVATQGNFSGGISFRDSQSRTSVGNEMAHISCNQYKAMDIYSLGTININHGVNSSGTSIQEGGNVGICSLTIESNTIKGSGGGYMYANSNCMFHPASGYHAYINTTDEVNKIMTYGGGAISSRNVKKDLVNIQDDYKNLYEEIRNMNLYTFKYKYKGIKDREDDFGFIIDELEDTKYISKYIMNYDLKGNIVDGELLPKADDDVKDEDLHFSYKGWDRDSYLKCLFVMIKALQNKIDELEEKYEQ